MASASSGVLATPPRGVATSYFLRRPKLTCSWSERARRDSTGRVTCRAHRTTPATAVGASRCVGRQPNRASRARLSHAEPGRTCGARARAARVRRESIFRRFLGGRRVPRQVRQCWQGSAVRSPRLVSCVQQRGCPGSGRQRPGGRSEAGRRKACASRSRLRRRPTATAAGMWRHNQAPFSNYDDDVILSMTSSEAPAAAAAAAAVAGTGTPGPASDPRTATATHGQGDGQRQA